MIHFNLLIEWACRLME